MTRFRLVLVAAIVAVVGWNILHRGPTWKTYEDANERGTIDRPASATVRTAPPALDFSAGTLSLPPRDAGSTKQPDTQPPLDPVDFLPAPATPLGGPTARAM